jgi:excinuclease UvrABC nuclease subunit
MLKAAMDLDFEKAAQLRDRIKKIENLKMEFLK